METVVVQTAGDVANAHLQAELAEVNNHLVATHAVLVGIENLVVLLQAGTQVVGIEDGVLGGLGQALAAQHQQIAIADGEQQSVAVRCTGHSVTLLATHFQLAMFGQEVKQFGTHGNGTHTGTAATVRTCKRLVQVQMAHVGSHVSGAGEANLCVHVGTVHIDQSTGTVDDINNFQNTLFESTVSGRISNHDAGQIVLVLLHLCLEVVDVHIAAVVTFHHHNRHAGLGGAGGVGSVGTGGNKAHVALSLSLVDMVVAYHGQTAVLASSTRVGLQRHSGKTCNNGQQIFHFVNQLVPTLCLVRRRKGMDGSELAPAQRQHLGGGIQLHGAAAQRNHGTVQAQVLHLQFLHVAHHLGLAVILVEYAVGQILGGAHQVLRQGNDAGTATAGALQQFGSLSGGGGQNCDNLVHIVAAGGLVNAYADALGADIAEIDMVLQGNHFNLLGRHRALQCQSVEESAVVLFVAVFLQFLGQNGGNAVDIAGNIANAFGTMPCGIETAHDGLQGRSSADIRCSLVAFDMLLAHTQSHTQGGITLHVHTPTNNAARECTLEGLGDGKETSVGTAKAHRQTKALVATESAVGTHLAGSLHHGQGHQVGSHTHENALLVALGDKLGIIAHLTKLVGVLHDDTKILGSVEVEVLHLTRHNLDIAGSGVGAHHVERLRQHTVVNKNLVHSVFLSLTAAAGKEHQHALATGSCFVQKAGVGHRHVGHVCHHGLIGHQCLQTALANLGLIRSVGGIPACILKHVALNHGRSDSAVVSHTDIGLVNLVLLGQGTAAVQKLVFVDAVGYGHRFFQADSGRHSLVDKFFHRTNTDFIQHLLFVSRIGDTVVSRGEIVANHIVIL